MPIYEYECKKCGKNFETLVFGSNPEVKCPSCDSAKLRKLPSLFGFKSGGTFVSSAGPSGCDSCKATTCSSCNSSKG